MLQSQTCFLTLAHLLQVSPSQGAMSGAIVTVLGAGFSTLPQGSEVRVCDQPCRVVSANSTFISCRAGEFETDSLPVNPGKYAFEVQITDGADDGFEEMRGGIGHEGAPVDGKGAVTANTPSLRFTQVNKWWDDSSSSYNYGMEHWFLRFTNMDIPRYARLPQHGLHLDHVRLCTDHLDHSISIISSRSWLGDTY